LFSGSVNKNNNNARFKDITEKTEELHHISSQQALTTICISKSGYHRLDCVVRPSPSPIHTELHNNCGISLSLKNMGLFLALFKLVIQSQIKVN
jgi:hypothetical protein